MGEGTDAESLDHDLELEVVHSCQQCGETYTRHQMPAKALMAGVVECKVCGTSCSLNIVLRPKGSGTTRENS